MKGLQTSKLALAAKGEPASFRAHRVYALLVLFIIVTFGTTYVLYTKTQDLFRWSLDERLLGLASVGSTSFVPQQLDQISGPESVDSEIYKEVVLKLDQIRSRTRKVRYAYILRKTSDPNTLEFVADADSLTPDIPKDLDGDGIISEEDELNFPGDPYDVSELQEFVKESFMEPYVDPELVRDQWGTFLSGSAPIVDLENKNAPSKYIIGLDLDVTEFQSLTNLALVPFAFFIVFLLLVLTTLTVILKRMWKTQVRLLAEIDKQKDDMLHLVTHQLRGPVTRINNYTELLLDGTFGELTSDQKETITTIRDASQDMGNQTGTILAAAKIKADKLPITPAPLDLNIFFKSITHAAEDQAKEQCVDMKISIPPKLPTVMCDRQFTQIALDNLISNAIKYTALRWKGGGGSVNFIITTKKEMLKCTVQDTGIGIPKKDQDKVFGELFRASNSGTNGNGLGLYATMRIIKAQGGKLSFESEENKGTIFVMELPLKLATAEDLNAQKKKKQDKN